MHHLVAVLKQEEGFRGKMYKDTEGLWTIGYGWCLDRTPMTEEEADYMLRSHIARKTEELRDALPWIDDLDDVRKGVLVAMAFQMGVKGLLKFKNTLACIRSGFYDDAAANMRKSKWAHQTPARAGRMAKAMAQGTWPTYQ